MHDPKIVCLCGSTRFKEAFDEAIERETFDGKIVLSVGFFAHQQPIEERRKRTTPELKIRLDELHLRKIDLADEVLVLNVGGYVGLSTRREIWYTRQHHRGSKIIRWLEPVSVHGGVISEHNMPDYIDAFFKGWEDWRSAGIRAAAQS